MINSLGSWHLPCAICIIDSTTRKCLGMNPVISLSLLTDSYCGTTYIMPSIRATSLCTHPYVFC